MKRLLPSEHLYSTPPDCDIFVFPETPIGVGGPAAAVADRAYVWQEAVEGKRVGDEAAWHDPVGTVALVQVLHFEDEFEVPQQHGVERRVVAVVDGDCVPTSCDRDIKRHDAAFGR